LLNLQAGVYERNVLIVKVLGQHHFRRRENGWALARLDVGIRTDEELLAVAAQLLDGLYEYRKRALLLGREPA
jgi:hypothetical protein